MEITVSNDEEPEILPGRPSIAPVRPGCLQVKVKTTMWLEMQVTMSGWQMLIRWRLKMSVERQWPLHLPLGWWGSCSDWVQTLTALWQWELRQFVGLLKSADYYRRVHCCYCWRTSPSDVQSEIKRQGLYKQSGKAEAFPSVIEIICFRSPNYSLQMLQDKSHSSIQD